MWENCRLRIPPNKDLLDFFPPFSTTEIRELTVKECERDTPPLERKELAERSTMPDLVDIREYVVSLPAMPLDPQVGYFQIRNSVFETIHEEPESDSEEYPDFTSLVSLDLALEGDIIDPPWIMLDDGVDNIPRPQEDCHIWLKTVHEENDRNLYWERAGTSAGPHSSKQPPSSNPDPEHKVNTEWSQKHIDMLGDSMMNLAIAMNRALEIHQFTNGIEPQSP